MKLEAEIKIQLEIMLLVEPEITLSKLNQIVLIFRSKILLHNT